jgi:iron complex outermembrane receptor protein
MKAMESKMMFEPSNLPSHRNKKQALKAICIGLTLLATQLNTGAAVEPTKRHFNIPAQELQSALNQFSESSDMQMSYLSTLAKGIATKGVSGDYTPVEALNKLLEGSGLVPIVTKNNTVTIEKANNGSMLNQIPKEPTTIILKPVNVTATATRYDVTDPYNSYPTSPLAPRPIHRSWKRR